MARKKKKRTYRKKYFSLWDAGVAYGNLSILTMGSLGTSPIGWITGKGDIGHKSQTGWTEGLVGTDVVVGGDEISLSDMLNEPAMSFDHIAANVKMNATGMAVNAIIFNTGAKVLRRALRQPINTSNRMIKQLGMGVKI